MASEQLAIDITSAFFVINSSDKCRKNPGQRLVKGRQLDMHGSTHRSTHNSSSIITLQTGKKKNKKETKGNILT